MSWIFDYFKAELDIDFFSENASLQAPNMSKFNSFITTFPYEAWANGIKFEYLDKEMLVISFYFIRQFLGKCQKLIEWL
jgi:hypothetical protein